MKIKLQYVLFAMIFALWSYALLNHLWLSLLVLVAILLWEFIMLSKQERAHELILMKEDYTRVWLEYYLQACYETNTLVEAEDMATQKAAKAINLPLFDDEETRMEIKQSHLWQQLHEYQQSSRTKQAFRVKLHRFRSFIASERRLQKHANDERQQAWKRIWTAYFGVLASMALLRFLFAPLYQQMLSERFGLGGMILLVLMTLGLFVILKRKEYWRNDDEKNKAMDE